MIITQSLAELAGATSLHTATAITPKPHSVRESIEKPFGPQTWKGARLP